MSAVSGWYALARYETRRAGWAALAATPVVTAGGALLALALAGKGGDPGVVVGFWLREVLPLAFGLGVAAVPGAERALEVQLSMPVPVAWTLGRRVALAALTGAAVAGTGAVAAALAGAWRPAHGLAAGQLTWLAPGLALAGVGVVAFAVSGSVAGAAAAVSGLWLVEELTGQWFAPHGWARPFYLFLDDRAGLPGGWWWGNRLGLVAVAAALAGVAVVVVRRWPERVFAAWLRGQKEVS